MGNKAFRHIAERDEHDSITSLPDHKPDIDSLYDAACVIYRYGKQAHDDRHSLISLAKRYGFKHKLWCTLLSRAHLRCTCGLDDAIREADDAG